MRPVGDVLIDGIIALDALEADVIRKWGQR